MGGELDSTMIQASGLAHYYGPYSAIQDAGFRVKIGEILGYLGAYDAGKTTTLRITTGFLPPSRGTAILGGGDVVEKSLSLNRHSAKRSLF